MKDLSSFSGKLFLLNLVALIYVANERLRLPREKMTVQLMDVLSFSLVISLLYLLISPQESSRGSRPHEGPNQFNLLNHDVVVPAADHVPAADPHLPANEPPAHENQQDPHQIHRPGPRTQVT